MMSHCMRGVGVRYQLQIQIGVLAIEAIIRLIFSIHSSIAFFFSGLSHQCNIYHILCFYSVVLSPLLVLKYPLLRQHAFVCFSNRLIQPLKKYQMNKYQLWSSKPLFLLSKSELIQVILRKQSRKGTNITYASRHAFLSRLKVTFYLPLLSLQQRGA